MQRNHLPAGALCLEFVPFNQGKSQRSKGAEREWSEREKRKEAGRYRGGPSDDVGME